MCISICASYAGHHCCLYISISISKNGWTGVLIAARYGFADIVRELITKYRCDRNAVKAVSGTNMLRLAEGSYAFMSYVLL